MQEGAVEMDVGLIMLAAGSSRRFGSNKLLCPVDGIPMYGRILEQLVTVAGEFALDITVVTRWEEIAEAAEKTGARVLDNPYYQEGISSSVKIGLRANLHHSACLFTVADQPWLTAETIGRLLKLYQESKKGIACVCHQGKTGNPCIFSALYYPELLELDGDVGGRKVLMAHREDAEFLEVEDEKELRDVDVRTQSFFENGDL